MAAATVAADAAPRSSSAADSYIGSLISLTSKSEIRYEGVLFNINTEESSIGLKNVRSFGTEGRKKDGPQVPPSNKIYEYILFRGSDIKDLQVKSSQPVQPAAPMHDDPAIIQSHYPSQGATSSTSLPYPGIRPAPDLSSQIPQGGVPRPPFQGSLPLYQPGRSSVGSWGPSSTPTTMDASGLAMPPTYWQGYYGPTNDLQAQQQSLLRPPLGVGMSMPPPPMQYPVVNNSQFSEYNPSFIPTMSSGSLATVSDISTNLIPDPLALDKSAIPPSISEKPQIAPDPVMPFNSLSDSMSLLANSVLNEGPMPSLVTPGQLLQPAPPTLQSFTQTAQKDVEVVQVSLSESPLATSIPAEPVAEVVELDERVQPLPSQADQRPYQQNQYPTNSYQNNRRGRGRGRGNEISRSATRFTEDFDFTAMNEKFNKDEVWGHLGKGNEAEEKNGNDVDGAGTSKLEAKPVYVKDDFFDSLSCDALGGGSRNRRPNYSEQSRRDNEGYGEFSRYRGGRGYGGGQSRGGYYGRGGGYGHNGRGRGGGYGMYGHGGESY